MELRAETTAKTNIGESRHSLARPVCIYNGGRFIESSQVRQLHRAAALNLVTACIGLFNYRYISRAVESLQKNGERIDDTLLRRLSPLGWAHINFTGDYVWSDKSNFDEDGFRPLNREIG